jgi:hypothetical protein
MARGPLTFRQRDVVRAIKAAKRAGLPIGRVEITRCGTITLISSQVDKELAALPERNPWDDAKS